ncbi:carph-isopro domain-containing protein [Sphingomonas carotinifaciens]|uniref:carph-isopro domain-containing protein n=1 Tax=Sphingomonas carotinifaciens TaxID=1166323 RepID=UPI001967F60D|nr:hypothetical protein [Sphingomonas carotinifaciens]
MYIKPMSIRSVISRFGGIRPMADKLGHRSHTTVQGWWDRDVIPAQRQREVLDEAKRRKIKVTADDLIASAPTSVTQVAA